MKKNLFLIFVGISIIIFASVRIASNNTIYYYTTTEANYLSSTSDERIKLGGFVVSNSVKKGELGATEFLITDGNVTMKISFDGFIPELFQDEMGVILDGYFSDDIFYSDDMLVKHDNEYISEDGEVYDVENYSE
uniref:Cytochrome c-type biogenesis protein CcmE n=1 Tax=Candidatus Actinomarina minuta TaxID=1389454 RepID=S5DRS7_9ACTN|nr:cytochrome c-type biogenesis protein CcmE [Candidatus Actinomarina minuta]